jgi:hypothetical protein
MVFKSVSCRDVHAAGCSEDKTGFARGNGVGEFGLG